jgi:hypothetical protein
MKHEIAHSKCILFHNRSVRSRRPHCANVGLLREFLVDQFVCVIPSVIPMVIVVVVKNSEQREAKRRVQPNGQPERQFVQHSATRFARYLC